MGGGSIRNRAPSQSVLRVRADCGGRLFTAKLGIIVHYLPHQLLDHLLADDRILLTVFAIASMTSSASACRLCLSLLVLFLNRGPKSLSMWGVGGRNYPGG